MAHPIADRRPSELGDPNTTLIEYVARRFSKTAILAHVHEYLVSDQSLALAYLAIYAIAGCTTFGPAKYQPRFDPVGTKKTYHDQTTGSDVEITYVSGEGQRNITIDANITIPGLGIFQGEEVIEGTTFGLFKLGMPAPTHLEFQSNDPTDGYKAEFAGTLTSELVPAILIRPWIIRAQGRLSLRDNRGNTGEITLAENGAIGGRILRKTAEGSQVVYVFGGSILDAVTISGKGETLEVSIPQ